MRKRRKKRLNALQVQQVEPSSNNNNEPYWPVIESKVPNLSHFNKSTRPKHIMKTKSTTWTNKYLKSVHLIKFLATIAFVLSVRECIHLDVLCDNESVSVSAGISNIVVGSRWQSQIFLPCKFDHLDEDQTVSIPQVTQISVYI